MAVATRSARLVDIVREFLSVDRSMAELIERREAGTLGFAHVQELVSDSEDCALYRLKERCHALFRQGPGQALHREVLFDLAVGSLFHEAMKFREDYYQRDVYGPRVRALREEAGPQAESLFHEFEKIQSSVSARLATGLHETESLLDRTREQLRVLLAEHEDDGRVARYLIEQREQVEHAFGVGLDALLAEIHGDAAEAYARAARSYLTSGYYPEAEQAFREAAKRGGDEASLEALRSCALGMVAWQRRRYAESVQLLRRWAEGPAELDAGLVRLVHTAISKAVALTPDEERPALAEAAAPLLEKLGRLRGAAAAQSPAARDRK